MAPPGRISDAVHPRSTGQKSKNRRYLRLVSKRRVLLIVVAVLILQFMTWRAIDRLYIPSPPDCSFRSPCYAQGTVSVQGTVSLDSTIIRLISK
jgi:hypothetical protein